jgi:hypothetical protein
MAKLEGEMLNRESADQHSSAMRRIRAVLAAVAEHLIGQWENPGAFSQARLAAGDMLPALIVPCLFVLAFTLAPIAAAHAAAILSDLAPQLPFDGVADPQAISAGPIPWSTFRWVTALAIVASSVLFGWTAGSLAMGLYRFRCEARRSAAHWAARFRSPTRSRVGPA